MTGETRGYVLAGGQSSRMGMDKAEMLLSGRTLLEIAVGKLQRVCGEVVVVGQRETGPEGVRVIADRWAGCGPMGGIEAALTDVSEVLPGGFPGGRAMFLPVDMPLVPAQVLAGLAELWNASAATVCFLVVDGRAQPLLSTVRSELLPEVRDALRQGKYRVRPVLEGVAEERARSELPVDLEGRVLRTEISMMERGGVWPGWLPTEGEWASRELWFANLNTPQEFALAERFAGSLTSA